MFSRYLGVALLAGAVGALAGVLLAPSSGRSARKKLVRRFERSRKMLARKLRSGHKAVNKLAGRIEPFADGRRVLRRVH